MRGRRVAARVGIGVAVLLALLLVAVLILTMTDFGRERVRQLALDRVSEMVEGEIEVGRIGGNLLRQVRLIDVTIRDEQGRPFLEADTLATRFGLRALLRQRLELHDVRLVNAHVVLDKPPGEEWNYLRIFDTGPDEAPPGAPGWGDWVALEDLSLLNTRVTVRDEWQPPEGLTPGEEEAALRRALAGESREQVVAVPGGYQNLMEFRELDARLPRALIAHPDTAGMAFDLETLSGWVRPFSPPPARVRDLSGQFRTVNDSLFMSGVRAELTDSRLAGGGVYAMHSGDLLMIAHGDPISFPDLHWLYPELPERGGGSMWMTLELGSLENRIVVRQIDFAVGEARVAGRLDITTGDRLHFGQTDIQFARVGTGLLAGLLDMEIPRRGELTGQLALRGPPGSLRVDGDVRFDDAAGGSSRVVARGEVGVEPDLRFDGLRLRFDPLQAELARAVLPDLPLRGTIEGNARVSGTPSLLDFEAELALRDPRHGVSQLRLAGGLDRREELRLQDMVVDMRPFRLDLLRAELPGLPELAALPAGASATGRVVLDGAPSRALRVDGDVVVDDPATGRSEIGATGTLALRDGVSFRDLRVRASPLRVELVRPWLPDLPPGGRLEGSMRLHGDPAGFLHLSGRLAHHHPELGVSRLQVDGGIDRTGPLQLRDLDLRLEPLHLALVRAFAPELPLAGTLTGTASVDGSPESWISVQGDLVHEEEGERSHVMGSAEVALGPGGRAIVDVRLAPLSLDVAGRFAPAAGLRGEVTGRLRTTGNLSDLRLDADLRAADGGRIQAAGTLDLADPTPVYDLELSLGSFDLAAVTRRAPAETDLAGAVTARGRGLDPETMNARIVADLTGSGIGDVHADVVRLRLGLDDGLARIDSSLVRLDGAEAALDGTFALVAGRDGTLDYRVRIDSLHAFASWLPGAETAASEARPDSAIAPVTPTVLAAESEEMAPGAPVVRYVATDGSAVTETVTMVQTGVEREPRQPSRQTLPSPEPTADARPADAGTETARGRGSGDGAGSGEPGGDAVAESLPVDSLAGSVRAAGTLRGNVTRYDVDGRAVVDDLVYQGTYVGGGEAEFALMDGGTASPDVRLIAELREVRTATAAFDSISTRGAYRGLRGNGSGEVLVVAHGTEDTEYRADAEFDLAPSRRELRLADLTLRYDTISWRMPEPGVVSWADDAIQLADIDIRSNAGGRILLDGVLPVSGSGDLDVRIEDLEVEQVVALLQLEEDAGGRLDVDARVEGSLEDPRMTATARLIEARRDGEDLPDVRATFEYADRRLVADAELLSEGRVLATAEARVPMDLALQPDLVPRLLDGELAINLTADSLPVEVIPMLPEQVVDPRGLVRGELAVRGTTADPTTTGDMELELDFVRIAPMGIRLKQVAGRLTLDDDRLRVDSLVARSGGPVRVSGEVVLDPLTDPTFDLDLEGREVLAISTEDVELEVDADLSVSGSLSALVVEGEVRTRQGVVYIPKLSELGNTEVVSLHEPGSSQRIEPAFLRGLRGAQGPPLLDRMTLDVTLQVDRDVWLRSTEANVEIYTPPEVGPLRIRLDPEDAGLALEGTLSTDRGEYEFMSRRFDLTRGQTTFTGEADLDPVLQIAAEHEVRLPGREAFDIRVLLGGTLRDLEITLESNAQPPIAQTDLLSYLAFGRSATTLLYRQGSTLSSQGGDAGELVGNVAGLASQQLGTIAFDAIISDIEADLMRELGVDVFRITPADLPPDMFTGGYGDLLLSTEVEAGRYFSSQLFVAGQVNTGATRPGIRVEYIAPFGLVWRTSWRSQWLPSQPTLTERAPVRAGVLGTFLLREWRF